MDLDLLKIFLKLRLEYWDNKMPVIEIYYHDKSNFGEYMYPKNKHEDFYQSYSISIQQGLKTKQEIDTILHEMAHHYVFVNNKELVWNKKIYMHGKLWRQEMRRLGFTGKITKYT